MPRSVIHNWKCGPLLPLLLVLLGVNASGADPILYGGIEIGAKGVKGVAIPIEPSGVPNLVNVKKLKHTSISDVTLAALKDGKFAPEALAEAQAAVHDYYKHLTGPLKIDPKRIWIVASSGLTIKGKPSNFAELRTAVSRATEFEKELLEIDQETEVELLVRGGIPHDNWKDSVLLDIGSGNTKGGYYQPSSGFNLEKVVVVAGKLEGTVSFTQSIQAEMKKRNLQDFAQFAQVASELRKVLVDKVRDSEIGRKPGLVNRRKVFLSGGTPWAIATLTDPQGMLDDRPIVKFRIEELRKFHKALKETGQIPRPDLSQLPEAIREHAEDQVNSVLNTFTPENLLAGSEILFGFDEALRWQSGNKEVYFTKSGVLAWIIGFVGRESKK